MLLIKQLIEREQNGSPANAFRKVSTKVIRHKRSGKYNRQKYLVKLTCRLLGGHLYIWEAKVLYLQ